MTKLAAMQRAFYRAVAFGHDADLSADIDGRRFTPAQRLSIYRNNSYEGFRATLAATFPVIEKLVGQGGFRGLALDYLGAHPSRQGNLTEFGRHFPRFLVERYEQSVLDYLAAIAALEWAYQAAMCAADAECLRVESLAHVPSEDWDQLSLRLHPAVRLVSSDYPLLSIWKANRDARQVMDKGVLEGDGERVVLHRTHAHIEFRAVDCGEFALLTAFAEELSLSEALDLALQVEPTFDFEQVLTRAFGLELFSDYALAPELPTASNLANV